MRLTIAAAGKLKAGPERDLYRRYTGRIAPLGKSLALGPLDLVEVSESRAGSAAQRCAQEAESLLAKLPQDDPRIVLDETGKAVTSTDLAKMLASERDAGVAGLAFVIGGPDGHGAAMREKPARIVSLGAITLPHGLARVVLAEQLYRAVTILAGHPYHRG